MRTLCCLFLLVLLTAAGETCKAKSFYGTITKVIDGDSLIVATGQKKIELRLYGIDCPEYGQPYSAEAKQFSRAAVRGRNVLVNPYYYDTYGRLVAVVIRGDMTLNRELVRAGLAWVYPQYCRKSFCTAWEKSEQSARKDKRGLWLETDALSPWEWKGMHHKH